MGASLMASASAAALSVLIFGCGGADLADSAGRAEVSSAAPAVSASPAASSTPSDPPAPTATEEMQLDPSGVLSWVIDLPAGSVVWGPDHGSETDLPGDGQANSESQSETEGSVPNYTVRIDVPDETGGFRAIGFRAVFGADAFVVPAGRSENAVPLRDSTALVSTMPGVDPAEAASLCWQEQAQLGLCIASLHAGLPELIQLAESLDLGGDR